MVSPTVPRTLSPGGAATRPAQATSYADVASGGANASRGQSSTTNLPYSPFAVNCNYAVAFTYPAIGLTQQRMTQAFHEAHPSLRYYARFPRAGSLIVELETEEHLNQVIQKELTIDDLSLMGYPLHSVNPSLGLFSLRISNVPFLPIRATQQALEQCLAPFGEVLHCKEQELTGSMNYAGIYYTILQSPQTVDKLPPQLLQLRWEGRSSVVTVTPDSTPTFCSYCRAKDHLRQACKAPPPCNSCGLQTHATGHCRQRLTPQSKLEASLRGYYEQHKEEKAQAAKKLKAQQLAAARKAAEEAEVFSREMLELKTRAEAALRAAEASSAQTNKLRSQGKSIRKDASHPSSTPSKECASDSFSLPGSQKRRTDSSPQREVPHTAPMIFTGAVHPGFVPRDAPPPFAIPPAKLLPTMTQGSGPSGDSSGAAEFLNSLLNAGPLPDKPEADLQADTSLMATVSDSSEPGLDSSRPSMPSQSQ